MAKTRHKRKHTINFTTRGFIAIFSLIFCVILLAIFYISSTTKVQSEADTTPPTITITSPTDGGIVPRATVINLLATYSDESPMWLDTSSRKGDLKSMQFVVNGKIVCRTASHPDAYGGAYSCNWKTPTKPNYTFTLSAQAYDIAGNFGKSPQITLTTSN